MNHYHSPDQINLSRQQFNWARNISFSSKELLAPSNEFQIQAAIRTSDKIKALGTGHCFSTIADTDATHLSLRNFTDITLDIHAHTVTVGAGVRYGDLAPILHRAGYALPNLASLPHISVVGSIATATHGSGNSLGNLATSVTKIKLISGTGEVHEFSRKGEPEIFPGLVVHLGALGVVTQATLDLIPTFDIAQYVYKGLSFPTLMENFDTISDAAYSVSVFTNWDNEHLNQIWVKHLVKDLKKHPFPAVFLNAQLSPTKIHPIESVSPRACTEQLGAPGPWYERLPHFKLDFTPSSGNELQTEYFVPRKFATLAFAEVCKISETITPYLQVSEIRTIKRDDLWMSPCFNEDCVGIHFTWKNLPSEIHQILPLLEEKLRPFEARPHWGKIFCTSPSEVYKRYEMAREFNRIRRSLDPTGKFENQFLLKLFSEVVPE